MHYEHALRKMGLCVAVTTQSNNTLRICDARKDQDRLALDCTRKKKTSKKKTEESDTGGECHNTTRPSRQYVFKVGRRHRRDAMEKENIYGRA